MSGVVKTRGLSAATSEGDSGSFHPFLALAAPPPATRRKHRNNGRLNGDPGGIRTRDLDLERVASWARLDDGVGLRLSIPDPVVRLRSPGRPSAPARSRRS